MPNVLCRMGMALVSLLVGTLPAAEPAVWRSGWTSMTKPDETIACAREIGFNALVFHGPADRMKQWSAMTTAAGIESCHWFSPIVPENDADLIKHEAVAPRDERVAGGGRGCWCRRARSFHSACCP